MPIAKVNNININYEVEGDGEPLVIVPGICSSLHDWSRHVPYLRKYFQVIRLDNRGVGQSDKPAGDYSIAMMANDALALLDYLQIEQAHFLGTSMGGAIVQEMALLFPARAKKIIIANSAAKFSQFTRYILTTQAQVLELTGDFGLVYRVGMPWIFSPQFFEDQALVEEVTNMALLAKDKISLTGIKGQAAACISHDATARLGQIKAPTLVIAASEDILVRPDESEQMAKIIPNAQYALIYGVGHACPIEGFDEFIRIVKDFLLN